MFVVFITKRHFCSQENSFKAVSPGQTLCDCVDLIELEFAQLVARPR